MNISGSLPCGIGGLAVSTGDDCLLTRAFHEEANGFSHGLTGLLCLSPGLARGTLECMTSGHC